MKYIFYIGLYLYCKLFGVMDKAADKALDKAVSWLE